MIYSRKRIFPILAVCLLVLQIFTSLLSPVAIAQTDPNEDTQQDTTEEQSDSIQGQEIVSGPKEEFYYWDMEEKDGEQVPILMAKGGEYTEAVKLENVGDRGDTIDFYPIDKEWLPVYLNEPWCGDGMRLNGGHKDGFANDFLVRVPKDRNYGTVDMIDDGKQGLDTYEFSWTVEVDDSNPDEMKFVRVVEGFFDKAFDGGVFNKEKREECTYSFKTNFHVLLPYISPFDEVNPNGFQGKILGKRGMKYEDWLRRFNNLRDYHTLSQSAAKQITIHCKKFNDTEDCLSRLAIKFQQCYARASGLKDTSIFTGTKPLMSKEDMLRNFDTKDRHIWDHTIRANLTPFATCFGGNRYTADDPLDKSFLNERQGIDFGEWIAFGAVFHEQLYPYDVEEVSDSELPRGKAETRCSLGKMGWILCPVLRFFAKITDRLFNFIRQWLVVPPLLPGDGMAAFVAWKHMRNFANILFIIVLFALVIIYAAGGMLTTYNLRTMVPRIIIAAVLINISFYICSVLVDLSNVAGTSLYSLIREMTPPRSGVDEFGTWDSIVTHIAFAGGGAMLTAAGLLAGLAALVPLLLISLISMIIVLLSLLLRQAAIIILVIVAPLAFALRLLPGTSSWFEKWKTMFSQMLFLYPVIAIVFSGAYFSSNIIQGQAAEQGSALMAIFALAIQVIPLFLTPIVMKFGGNVINSFGGAIRSAVKSPADKVNQAAKTAGQDRKDIKDIRAAHRGTTFSRANPLDIWRRSRMRSDHKRSYREAELRRAQSKRVAGSGMLRGVAMATGAGSQDDMKKLLNEATAQSLRVKGIQIQERAAKEFNHDIAAMNERMLQEAADLGDYINAAAAAQSIVDSEDYNAVSQLIDNLNSLGDSEEANFVRNAVASKLKGSEVAKKHAHLRDERNIAAIKDGSATTSSMRQTTAARGDYAKPEVAATESPESIATLSRDLTPEQLNGFVTGFNAAVNKSSTAGKITPGALEAVAQLEAQLGDSSSRGGRG